MNGLTVHSARAACLHTRAALQSQTHKETQPPNSASHWMSLRRTTLPRLPRFRLPWLSRRISPMRYAASKEMCMKKWSLLPNDGNDKPGMQ
jgi:hypothetical protein